MEIDEAYKFCPRCGSRGDVSNSRLHCPSCKLDTYFNPKPATEVALRNDKGEFLFCVRAAEPYKGFLDFPGGFVDADETFEQAAKRELKEELGIEVEELEYLRSSTGEYLFQNINYRLVGNAFYAKLPLNSKIIPTDDVTAVEFYKLDDVPIDKLAQPTEMMELIDLLKARGL